MQMKYIDFKKYRTREHLLNVMVHVLRGEVYNGDRVRAVCPRPGCVAKKSQTLKAVGASAIAYCHCCHITMDALELIKWSHACDYRSAASHLDMYCESVDAQPAA